jgi:hypothetical protein
MTRTNQAQNLVNVAITDKAGYPHGMAQPAVLVLEKNASSPLYSWAIVPKMVRQRSGSDSPVHAGGTDNFTR